MNPVVMFILAAIVIIGIVIANAYFERKRREAMQALADRLGLTFNHRKDYALAKTFAFLNALRHGSNRYAFNTLTGTYQGHPVTIFDYHYETTSSNGKSTQKQHYYIACFTLRLPLAFPELKIGTESFLSKVAQAIGFDDIDFESHAFSSAFCVRSRDRKFAYDVCNARMIEYLLKNRDLTIEIENDQLALTFTRKLKPDIIASNLNRLIALRNLMPEYLFNR